MSAERRKRIRHAGPPDADRIDSFGGPGRGFDFTLAPGISLLEAVAGPLEQAGLRGAGVVFRHVRFKPFRYVIPAFSADPAYAAFYSATHAPAEEVEVTCASLTYGQRDGSPFVHCHALWRDRDGQVRGGHLLPSETTLSEPGTAVAFGTEQVAMISSFDPETNFTLFRPVPAADRNQSNGATPACVLARIKPNLDLVEGMEEVCRRHGVREALVRSGIGSIVGAEFADGRTVEAHPTELLVLDGRITAREDGSPGADLTIALIDAKGFVHEGRLKRGRNPVLICAEIVLERTFRPERAGQSDLSSA